MKFAIVAVLVVAMFAMVGAINPPVDPSRLVGTAQTGKAVRDTIRADGTTAGVYRALSESSTATNGSAVWFGNRYGGADHFYAALKAGLTSSTDSSTGYVSLMTRPGTTAQHLIEQFRVNYDGSAKFWGTLEVVGLITGTITTAQQAGTLTGDLDPDQLSGDATDDNKIDSSLIPKVSAVAVADSAKAIDTTLLTLAEMVADRVGGMVTGNTETGLTVTYQDGDNTIDFALTLPVDSATGAARAEVADSAKQIDTTLATLAEMVADRVGGMLTGNTETGITVTYEDGDNTIDFVVSGAAADSSFVSMETDTAKAIGAGGLNLDGKTGGVRILDSESERFRFEGDSLLGPGRIAKDFRHIESDSVIGSTEVYSPRGRFNEIVGQDTTLPTEFRTGIDLGTTFIKMQHQGWIGRDSNSTRIELDTNTTGTQDDAWLFPLGLLSIGTHSFDNKRGIQMGSNVGVTSDFGLWIEQNDSSASYPCAIDLNGTTKNDSTGGGDIYISWSYKNADGDDLPGWAMGIDASDGYRWKLSRTLHSLSTTHDVMITDSLKRVIFPDGLYLSDNTSSTDYKAVPYSFVRQTEQIALHGGSIYWTPEPMKTVNKFLTYPWIDTTTTYSYPDSLPKHPYLWRASDTTANNDSLFVVTRWMVDAPCSLFTVNYCGKTSSATAATSSLDSAILYVNGTRTSAISVAAASTALDTTVINFADQQLSAGDNIIIIFRYLLTNDTYADCQWATIERRKR